jgi:hypothetical protein
MRWKTGVRRKPRRQPAWKDPPFSSRRQPAKWASISTPTHLFYAVDVASEPARLFIIAPHVVKHRGSGWDERKHLKQLEAALSGFTILRAGKAGLFKLSALGELAPHDLLFGAARTWVSASPYRPARHRGNRRNDKHGCNLLRMIAKERLPALRRPALPRHHVDRNRGLRDIDSQFEQLAVDPGSATSGFTMLILRTSRAPLCQCVADYGLDGTSITKMPRIPCDANGQPSQA